MPTTRAKGAAQALLKKGIGDGNVYSVVLLKAMRSELAATLIETCFSYFKLQRSLASKKQTLLVMNK
jgi:hypothetical protein